MDTDRHGLNNEVTKEPRGYGTGGDFLQEPTEETEEMAAAATFFLIFQIGTSNFPFPLR
jgi:hypothetical protein